MEGLSGDLVQLGVDLGWRLVSALAIFVIGRWLSRLLASLVVAVISSTNEDETLVGFMRNLTYFFLLTATVVAALNRLGVISRNWPDLVRCSPRPRMLN